VHTATPITHLVVIFDENGSFDHYLGTYPKAANTDGTPFQAAPGTPQVDGLTPALLAHNPNQYNPSRLTPAQAITCDQNHGYLPEQKAYNGGPADKVVQNTSVDACTGLFGQPGLAMDYYDDQRRGDHAPLIRRGKTTSRARRPSRAPGPVVRWSLGG
jgi:phospholipase C